MKVEAGRVVSNRAGPRLPFSMHVAFALFADAANLSQEGKLNILGVFDALQVAALPALHPRATLVVHFKATPADVGAHRVSIRWVSASGSELWTSDGEMGVATPPPGVVEMDLPLIAQIDLPLDVGGGYAMRIAIDGEMCADVPLQVRAASAAPMPPTPVWMS